MNDFTKKELIELRGAFEVNPFDMKQEFYNALMAKIEYMIENYCEHEKVVPNWGPNTECDKCGEIW